MNIFFVRFITFLKFSLVLTDDNVPVGKCRVSHDTKPTFENMSSNSCLSSYVNEPETKHNICPLFSFSV